ncbi:MAG TPA: hypothetical protein VI248_28665 [Kineosporiaceae bacterium]
MSYPTERPPLEVHTLGPEGTNCEAAAHHWLASRTDRDVGVVLHATLEEAVTEVLAEPDHRLLLACVVYPALHEIVFRNLAEMVLQDCFVMPTHNMVLAGRSGRPVRTVASHPAPVNLLDGSPARVELVTSNAQAAIICAAGTVDACITTLPAARAHGLDVLTDFGPVPMGFTVHAPQPALAVAR